MRTTHLIPVAAATLLALTAGGVAQADVPAWDGHDGQCLPTLNVAVADVNQFVTDTAAVNTAASAQVNQVVADQRAVQFDVTQYRVTSNAVNLATAQQAFRVFLRDAATLINVPAVQALTTPAATLATDRNNVVSAVNVAALTCAQVAPTATSAPATPASVAATPPVINTVVVPGVVLPQVNTVPVGSVGTGWAP